MPPDNRRLVPGEVEENQRCNANNRSGQIEKFAPSFDSLRPGWQELRIRDEESRSDGNNSERYSERKEGP